MDSEKYIEACRESDNEKFEKHPAPPAIPKEVRDTLLHLLDKAGADIRAYFGNSKPKLSSPYEVARSWLASAPVATDKAVCPKCGHREMFTPETKSVCCFQCGEIYDLEIMFISKPRTEKGEDRK
jgi:hypothetical protein